MTRGLQDDREDQRDAPLMVESEPLHPQKTSIFGQHRYICRSGYKAVNDVAYFSLVIPGGPAYKKESLIFQDNTSILAVNVAVAAQHY
jgi:hypothetical protein